MADADLGKRPFIVDEIILICKGCQGERRFPQNPHLRSAEEVIQWLQTKAEQCPNCNATTCDAKLRLVDPS